MARYREEYQITNPSGEPVGPPQIFEAETKDEMISKIKAAHQNAASKFYETKRAVKLGLLLEPDPDQPIQTFEERQLTADERVRIADEMKNPATADAALTRWLEAKVGAPIETFRENLRETEQNRRIRFVQEQVELFKTDHPEYVESEINRDTLVRYLNKKKWPITKTNLELAFADLVEDGLLITQVARQTTEGVPASVATEEVPPAPNAEPEITVPATAATPISEAAVRPRVSSSGLGREHSSVGSTPATIQPKGITIQEVNAMTSQQYADRLRTDPTFKEQVEALFAPVKK